MATTAPSDPGRAAAGADRGRPVRGGRPRPLGGVAARLIRLALAVGVVLLVGAAPAHADQNCTEYHVGGDIHRGDAFVLNTPNATDVVLDNFSQQGEIMAVSMRWRSGTAPSSAIVQVTDGGGTSGATTTLISEYPGYSLAQYEWATWTGAVPVDGDNLVIRITTPGTTYMDVTWRVLETSPDDTFEIIYDRPVTYTIVTCEETYSEASLGLRSGAAVTMSVVVFAAGFSIVSRAIR